MGLFDAFKPVKAAVEESIDIAASLAPYNSDSIGGFFAGLPQISRSEAMSVPTIARARGIICTSIASLPLETKNIGSGETLTSPRVLNQPDPRISGMTFWSWLIEDLWLTGSGYCRVMERYADTGRVRSMERIAPDRITLILNARATEIDAYQVDGMYIDPSELVVFTGVDEGILARAGRTIKAAVALEKSAMNFALNPIPQTVLKSMINMPKERVKALVDGWRASRQNGTQAFLNGDVELTSIGYDPKSLQMNEARQYVALELCRAANLPAWFASAEPNSFTYSNATETRRSLIDFSLRGMMSCISERLSFTDFTPQGNRVVYDIDDFLRGNPLEQAQIYETLHRISDANGATAITIDEIREEMEMLK